MKPSYPIVILHGWGWPISSPQWTRVKELLEKQGYRVFVPDLPGFGNAAQPTQSWSLDDYAEWVNDFCEKNNLARIYVLGHSFGGSVAAKFSVAHPEKIKKMVLVDSAGIRRKRLKKEIQKAVAHFLNRFSFLPFYGLVRKIAYRTVFRHSDYFLTEGVMKATYLKVLGEDISSLFPHISLPTLLVWGEKDGVTPLSHAKFMKHEIPGAALEIIPGVGHNPHRETPEKLSEIILAFIKTP